MTLTTIPEWIGTALLGAVIAALGFVGKQLYELWSGLRKAQAARLASLTNLSVLLAASRTLFLVQNRWARSLLEMLGKKYPDAVDAADGFEAAFSTLHDEFSSEETALHNQIRDWNCAWSAANQ